MKSLIRCQTLVECNDTCESLFPFLKVKFDGSSDNDCQYGIERSDIGGLVADFITHSRGVQMSSSKEDRELTMVFVERGSNVIERRGREVASCPSGDCTISTLLAGDVVKVGPGSARLLLRINLRQLDDVISRHFHLAPPASIIFPSAVRAEQPQRAILGGLIRQALIGLAAAEGPFAPILSKQYSDTILSSLLLSVPNSFSNVLGKAGEAATSRYVKRALDFIRANIDKPIDLDDIARHAACSPRRLQLAFRTEYGTTPMAVLKMRRLELAKERLRSGECGDVTTLAWSLGFTNPGRFAGEFRQKFGVLPSDILATGRS